jgi:hypothetical protein
LSPPSIAPSNSHQRIRLVVTIQGAPSSLEAVSKHMGMMTGSKTSFREELY